MKLWIAQWYLSGFPPRFSRTYNAPLKASAAGNAASVAADQVGLSVECMGQGAETERIGRRRKLRPEPKINAIAQSKWDAD